MELFLIVHSTQFYRIMYFWGKWMESNSPTHRRHSHYEYHHEYIQGIFLVSFMLKRQASSSKPTWGTTLRQHCTPLPHADIISGGLLPSHAFASRYVLLIGIIWREWVHQLKRPGWGDSGCRDNGWRQVSNKAVGVARLESTNWVQVPSWFWWWTVHLSHIGGCIPGRVIWLATLLNRGLSDERCYRWPCKTLYYNSTGGTSV
jgi:hypothetical protein